MISLNLSCDQGHHFEGVFPSRQDFEDQRERKLVACPICDSTQVQQALSTPAVRGGKGRARNTSVASAPNLTPAQARQFMQAMRARVMETHEDVGQAFAEEARKIHYGEAEERGIRGAATGQEVKALVEEGIEVLPLPPETKGDA